MNALITQPWSQVTEVARLYRALHARFVLRQCAEVGLAPSVVGTIWIHDGGSVRLGDRVRLNAMGAPIELHAFQGAEIVIGNDVVIEGGVSIEAHGRVTIGDGVVLEGFCKIIDNHFHAVRGDRHRRPESSPVVIEPGVTVGRKAIILPGAHIRAGTVVRPGALVRREPRIAPAQED
jgi:acetyltransferase-like isoleucine patch superfamily enzyme